MKNQHSQWRALLTNLSIHEFALAIAPASPDLRLEIENGSLYFLDSLGDILGTIHAGCIISFPSTPAAPTAVSTKF